MCLNNKSYISDTITRIEARAFAFCRILKTVEIDQENSKLTYIGSGAFYDCTTLEEVVIPNAVINIETYAFQNCSAMEYVNIDLQESKLSSIGANGFYGCKNVSSLNIF